MRSAREAWLRVLLRLQPRSVRRDHGADWLDTARRRDADAARGGLVPLLTHRLRESVGAATAGLSGRIAGSATRSTTSLWEGMMGGRMLDLRYAVRSLKRAPGFTVVSAVVLATGIAAATTIFSGVHAVLLAPLPFAQPDRLVGLWERNPDFGWDQADAAPANVLDWRDRVDAFADVAAYRGSSVGRVTWLGEDGPASVAAIEITGNLFRVLEIPPALGTLPTFEDTWIGPEPWVVVSHAFWTNRLGADPAVVGTALQLDGTTPTIRAVMPEGFRFPNPDVELWGPYGWSPEFRAQDWFRRAHYVTPVARLEQGASVERARAELEAVAATLQVEHPTLNRNMFAGLTPLRSWLTGDLAQPLRALMAAVAILLVLACVNVGNLFMVRAAARTEEFAMRRAMGASRGRIVAQLMAEGLLVALAGGIIATALSAGGITVLERIRPIGLAGTTAIEPSVTVLGFAVATSLLSALAFALYPALRATRGAHPARISGQRSHGGSGGGPALGMGGLLIPTQTAMAALLVLSSGLITRSFVQTLSEDPGIEPDGVWAFTLSAPSSRYGDRDAVLGFWERVISSLEASPGVEGAAVTGGVPLTRAGWTSQVVARDWTAGRVGFEVRHRAATPDYFQVMGVPLVTGRGFTRTDGLDGTPVAIVNQSFVDAFMSGEEVLGREVTFDREPTDESIWRTIVGVVGDERQLTLTQPPAPEIWEPLPQDWGNERQVVVSVAGAPTDVRGLLQHAVERVDDRIPVDGLRSMVQIVDDASSDARFLLLLFGLFAGLALMLAAVGVFGVTAQSVRRRVPEFGVRIALGAGARQVEDMVLRRVLILAAGGIAVGTGAALALAGALEPLLYRTSTRDVAVVIGAPALLFAVALAAGWLPARKASKVDPMISLRSG